MLKTTEEEILKRQDKRFRSLRDTLPEKFALYICCAAFNVAYRTDIDALDWIEYNLRLKKREGLIPKFLDGIIDVRTVIRDSYDNQERWVAEWGKGGEKHPYTEDDYRRLDEIFSTQSSRFEKMGGMDAQQDFTLHTCAKMQLESEKAIERGGKENIDIASKLLAMIQKQLESEQLRKKDSKPVEVIALDGIVDALRKKHGISAEMTYDEVMTAISKWLRKGHHYDMTTDAADHMLLGIINCMRKNNDEPEIEELPDEMRFNPKYAAEFEENQSKMEQAAYHYLGMTFRGGNT